MINRIREIRKAKHLTLAGLAAACDPPTTAQTIGRLETGTRTLSTKWMDRIGAALGVDPQVLVRSEDGPRAQIIAELDAGDVHPLDTAREAILPTEIAGAADRAAMIVIEVTAPAGEYRAGDTIWLRRIELTGDRAGGAGGAEGAGGGPDDGRKRRRAGQRSHEPRLPGAAPRWPVRVRAAHRPQRFAHRYSPRAHRAKAAGDRRAALDRARGDAGPSAMIVRGPGMRSAPGRDRAGPPG